MKSLDLREGEGRAVGITFAAMVLVVAAHTSLETVRDALFLTRLGPGRLAVVMALLAVVSLLAARLNVVMTSALGRRDALMFTLVGAAWGASVFAVAPLTSASIFVLYLFSALVGTLLLAQLWVCTADQFTVAQGRRLFPVIGAGAVMGAILGAVGTAAWLTRGDVRALLLIAATLFLATGLLVSALPHERAVHPEEQEHADSEVAPTEPSPHESPYVGRVAVMVGLAAATVLVADYLFKTRVAAAVPKAHLGEFLARYYGVTNVAALVVQLLLARPLLRRLGVAGALLVLPVALFAGAAGVLLTGGALIAILIVKGMDGSFRHSLQRLCTELVILPLSAETRSRSKPLFDGVVGRGVQATLSLILLGLSLAGWATTPVLAGMLAAFSLAWSVAALSLRGPYLNLFRRALARGTLEHGDDQPLDLPAVASLLQALASRDEKQAIAAMEVLRDRGGAGLVPALILLHDSERVVLRALRILSDSDRDDWHPLAERLLLHASPRIRLAAVRALGSRSAEVASMTNDPDPSVRAIAAFALASREAPAQDVRMSILLDAPAAEGFAARGALLSVIATDGDRRWAPVLARIFAEDTRAHHADEAAAIAKVGDARFLPRLLANLATPALRSSSRAALVTFDDRGLSALAEALSDVSLALEVRREVPLAVARFHSQRAAELLCERLGHEPLGVIRFRILRGLGALARDLSIRLPPEVVERELRRNLLEHARIAALLSRLDDRRGAASYGGLIADLLEDKRVQAVERIFRLLQLGHRGEDLRSLHYGLRSHDPAVRANAFEFLEALTTSAGHDASIAALLRLATDDLSPRERGARAEEFVEVPRDPRSVVALLADDRDRELAELARRHAAELSDEHPRSSRAEPTTAPTATEHA